MAIRPGMHQLQHVKVRKKSLFKHTHILFYINFNTVDGDANANTGNWFVFIPAVVVVKRLLELQLLIIGALHAAH